MLNQRIENGLRLSRGQVVGGWLLATGLQRAPIEYGYFAVPFQMILWDQYGNDHHADGRLSVVRTPQRYTSVVRRGSGLDGLDNTERPRELSPGEESARRYRDLVAQELGHGMPTTKRNQ